MEDKTNTIPQGYMEDSQGRLVPLVMVKEIDLLRNDLVLELIAHANNLTGVLAGFKASAMDDFQTFVDLSAEKYGEHLGGRKGNVTLFSYDGRYKITRAIDEFITFDERLQAAKGLIDECLKKWSVDSRPEIITLVNDAFQVDKAGRINTNRVLGLRRLDIQDETWRSAMQAISDSVQVINSKSYIRFYSRQKDGSYLQLNLNISA